MARMARDYVEVYGRLMTAARREDAGAVAIGSEQPIITTERVRRGRLGDHERRHGPGRGADERLTCHLPTRCGSPRIGPSVGGRRWRGSAGRPAPDLRARRAALRRPGRRRAGRHLRPGPQARRVVRRLRPSRRHPPGGDGGGGHLPPRHAARLGPGAAPCRPPAPAAGIHRQAGQLAPRLRPDQHRSRSRPAAAAAQQRAPVAHQGAVGRRLPRAAGGAQLCPRAGAPGPDAALPGGLRRRLRGARHASRAAWPPPARPRQRTGGGAALRRPGRRHSPHPDHLFGGAQPHRARRGRLRAGPSRPAGGHHRRGHRLRDRAGAARVGPRLRHGLGAGAREPDRA